MEGGRKALLYRAGLIASSLVALLLAGSLLSFFVDPSALGLQNWLVVLFRVESGQLSADALRALKPIDFAALALVGLAFLGLWPLLGRGRKVWMTSAVALPYIGMVALLSTGLAGRSSVMGAGVIVSLLMLRTQGFRAIGALGVLANSLLLLGDFATTGSRAPVVVASIALGYVLLLVWFAWIAASLPWQVVPVIRPNAGYSNPRRTNGPGSPS